MLSVRHMRHVITSLVPIYLYWGLQSVTSNTDKDVTVELTIKSIMTSMISHQVETAKRPA